MTDIHFYHLESRPLDGVLPTLLVRSRERGWRALVRVGNEQRLAALDDHLWTYADESFLPHGTDREAGAPEQPVLLTEGEANLNGAAVLFVVEGAEIPADIAAYARVVLMIEGRDEDAVAAARETWRRLRGEGHDVTYWQQDEDGRWQKRG